MLAPLWGVGDVIRGTRMNSAIGMRMRWTRGIVLLLVAVLFALVGVVAPAPVRAASYYVGNTGDTSTTGQPTCMSAMNTTCTLREALSFTNMGVGGDTIAFTAGTNGTAITLTTGMLVVTTAVTITGNGPANTTIAQSSPLPNVFTVSAPGMAQVAFAALTIRGGNIGIENKNIGNSGNAAVTVTNAAITGNNTGLSLDIGSFSITLIGSTVSGNTSGGGIRNGGATAVTLINSTVSGNTATGGTFGGGIASISSTVTLVNSTVSGNTASSGGGIYIISSTLNLANSIVAGNTDSSAMENNIVNVGSSFNPTGVNITSGDPLLAPLGNYGGPTQTQTPLSGSPALNTGNATICAAAVTANPPGAGGKDQRGVTRPQGAACDVGAVEVRSAVVNNTGDGVADATRCYNAAMLTCRLRDAIAATDAGGTITFSTTVFPPMGAAQTITLNSGQLLIDRDVTITGPGAGVLTVNGNMMSRVFRIGVGCGCGVLVEISGLTVTGGNGGGGGGSGGGGILNPGCPHSQIRGRARQHRQRRRRRPPQLRFSSSWKTAHSAAMCRMKAAVSATPTAVSR